MVFVPAGVDHCPVYFKRVDYPIWFLATAPMKTYKSDIMPGDENKKE
jgi:hypothetical protein